MNLGDTMKRTNYLNNKDILAEIHKSKSTFCSFTDADYADFDIILPELSKINIRTIAEAKRNKAKKLQQRNFEEAKSSGKKVKLAQFEIDYKKIKKDELIFRIMTYEHIPEEPGRKKNPKTIADTKTKVNFPPFKHYALVGNNWKEVVRSHWKGDLTDGHFCVTHGKTNDKLAKMYLMLCHRYSMRGNWRGYTYVDEMRGQAILQLSQIGLQFNEAKSNNPFAYYTAAVNNSFTRVLNLEKRNQNIRDDLLEEGGLNPSFTRTFNAEWEARIKED